MKGGVLEMKNKDNQSTIYNFFKPKVGAGEENNIPTDSVFAVPSIARLDSPKPNRIIEDLDAALLTHSVELPTMPTVPSFADALSVQDNMKLWTILGFLEDHAKGYLGSDILVPDLDNFRLMVLNGQDRFKELLEIYEALYAGVRKSAGKREHIDAFVIPEILSRYFMAEGEEKWGNMLANTEFVELHPHSHIDMMYQLIDSIMDTAPFRDHVSGLDDILAQLKAEREKKIAIRESSLLSVKDFDGKLAEISEELKELNKVDGVVDLDDEEFIVRSRSKRKKDAEEEDKRIENIRRLTQKKDLLESKRTNALQKIADVDKFLKNEKPDREVADLRLRGKSTRLCGCDRNGRLFWRLPVSSREKLEGLLVESVIYFVHENDADSVQVVEELPIVKKQERQKKKKRKTEDSSSDLSSYNPSDVEMPSLDDSSEVMLSPDVCTVRLELKSIFEYIDSHVTLLDLQNSLNANGLREYPLKKALKYFISENQDALFSDDKDSFLNAFLDWILSRNKFKPITGNEENSYKESALHLIHQILPYIMVGLNLEIAEKLPSDLQECIELCETLKDTPFYRNRQLYKELATIKTYSAMIHWLQRAESYAAYLIQKEEIKELRQEMNNAREQRSVSVSSSRQISTSRSTDATSSETSKSRNRKNRSSKSGSSGRQKDKKSDNSRFRRSGRNVNRKDYAIKLAITSSEISESDSETDSTDKRRSQRVRLKKMRDVESIESESQDSSEDDLVVSDDDTNA